MLDSLLRLGTSCARMVRFVIGSLKFRANILYIVCREMRRTYRALVATGAQWGSTMRRSREKKDR